MEKSVCDSYDLQKVLERISLGNSVLDFKWKFEFEEIFVHRENGGGRAGGWLVWVSFERPDITTGWVGRGRGREEIVWEHASESSVIKTAWLLVELMVRHELMESFRVDGCRVFNPHHTISELSSLEKNHTEEK